ncbi:MAG TPA: N-acetyl-gamma-glutamyl-phosphate reductase [Acidimicrobiales bacterium]|nr:N-acetyl-gamma-glutamyl-phosphate reductase [Acidimicrobiales bacterium]
MKAGVVGASGYGGTELLRLCAAHPHLDVVVATGGTSAGELVGRHTPSLAAAYPALRYEDNDPGRFLGLDVVFLAMPHGQSQRLIPQLAGHVGVVVDLAADFRLKDASLYPRWYGDAHDAPALLAEFVYGLPELFRSELRGARLIAAPGCYPTAAALALAPFTRAGLLQGGVIVDAASGVSGAGRTTTERLQFSAVDEDFSAYSLLTHRHTPEIEQILGHQVLFTPHLVPMTRGLLATCYAQPARRLTTSDAMTLLAETYAGERFVVVTEDPPSTKSTSGSNTAHVTARVDERTGWLVALCALDNLVKGAAGQAVQCANLALGLDEGAGLPLAAVYP